MGSWRSFTGKKFFWPLVALVFLLLFNLFSLPIFSESR